MRHLLTTSLALLLLILINGCASGPQAENTTDHSQNNYTAEDEAEGLNPRSYIGKDFIEE